jgi:hypothetical protein
MGLSTYTTLDGQHTLPRGPRTTAKFVSRHTSLFVTLVSTLVLTYCSNTIRVVLCRLEWPPLRPWRWCRRWSRWAWWCWLFFGLLRLQRRPKIAHRWCASLIHTILRSLGLSPLHQPVVCDVLGCYRWRIFPRRLGHRVRDIPWLRHLAILGRDSTRKCKH